MMPIDKTTPEPDDYDLSELFKASNESPPEALNLSILAQASAAHDVVKQPVLAETSKRALNNSVGRWFAVAATVLLGIAIAPQLLQSPESSLGSTSLNKASTPSGSVPAVTEEGMAAERAVSDEAAVSDELDTSEDVSAPTSSTPRILESEALRAPASQRSVQEFSPSQSLSNQPLRQQSQPLEQRAGGAAGDEVPIYRESADDWVEHIRWMMDNNLQDDAVDEFRLFRQAHPDYEIQGNALDALDN